MYWESPTHRSADPLGNMICDHRPPSRVNSLLLISEAQGLKSPMMYGQARPADIRKRDSRLRARESPSRLHLEQDDETKLFDASNESLIDACDGNKRRASHL
ncbi:hypothetical protein E4U30_001414 [Claviceps sp. LM220 group G6]|nr:hypothetical protein E4U30_001414 [Claviceps sp. LM220 group G6]KAG6099473.1 hypothetical protein E4U31_004383 [Claviceps sp. LM219 group G6]